MVHLFRSKHALQLNPGLFVRHRAAVASLVAFCLSLRCAVVADTLSLRAGGVASLLGQACVLGQTHASVDAPHSLTLLPSTASSPTGPTRGARLTSITGLPSSTRSSTRRRSSSSR